MQTTQDLFNWVINMMDSNHTFLMLLNPNKESNLI